MSVLSDYEKIYKQIDQQYGAGTTAKLDQYLKLTGDDASIVYSSNRWKGFESWLNRNR